MENHGYIVVKNIDKKTISCIKLRALFFALKSLYINNEITGRKKILIPVGLTRNIKPMQNPDRNPYLLNSFLSNHHFVNVKKAKEQNAVNEKSIK